MFSRTSIVFAVRPCCRSLEKVGDGMIWLVSSLRSNDKVDRVGAFVEGQGVVVVGVGLGVVWATAAPAARIVIQARCVGLYIKRMSFPSARKPKSMFSAYPGIRANLVK